MANGFSINELLKALQFAIVEAQEIAENQHARQIAEYFKEDGTPVTIPLKLPNPHPNAGETNAAGESIPQYVTVDVPKITLVPQNSIVIKELEMQLEVPLGDLDTEAIDWQDNEIKEPSMTDEQWDKNIIKNRLQRRPSKRAMVDDQIRALRISGKGSFFSRKNKQTAKLKIKFEGTNPPEVLARIEQSLVKGVET